MKKVIRIFDIMLFFVCFVIFGIIIWANVFLPNTIISYDNSSASIFKVFNYSNDKSVTLVNSQKEKPKQENLKLLGIVPVKTVSVTYKNEQNVLVSGDVFGIKFYTDGVLVVSTQDIQTESGTTNPATKAGIRVGDVIVSINNEKVYTSDAVEEIFNSNMSFPYIIKIKRGDVYKDFSLSPVYSPREGCYRVGLWVRDSTAGIGTMTFMNTSTNNFAALGHQINDVDTNDIMPLLKGEAVPATVTKVEKGTTKSTGSLECSFGTKAIGNITKNTEYGIYGGINSKLKCIKSYPVASSLDVHTGGAKMLSTIDSNGVKAYDIEITHISYNSKLYKNLTVKITDKNLIKSTGGIVQGMSGSPVIQDGKLVGAITHVIVNNPEKGYAIFAQTMLEQTE